MDFASVIRQGEKEYNSDYMIAFEDETSCCFVVADGRDTPGAAELVVNTVAEDFKMSGAITKSSVCDFIVHAGECMREKDETFRASAAILLTDGSVAVWGNIGDCRVYLLRDNLLYEITPDHSSAYTLYEAGGIRYPKIRKKKIRHDLTRVLGNEGEIKPSFSQPEIIRKGDAFLVCTDGFWENIHELQIEKTLKKSKTAQDWLNRMLKIIDKNIHRRKYTRFKDSMSAVTIKM